MKKFLYCIFIFIGVFLFSFSSEISAKSVTKNNITINFDDDDILNMAYRSINSFKILDDKSFYFNGIKHVFNENYTLVDDSISVDDNQFILEGETLSLDLKNSKVVSSKVFETYGFMVSVDIDTNKEYKFTQEICYKYGDVEECNSDKDDEVVVSDDVDSVFYYDFLPFYNDNIEFEYITYRFTMSNEEENIVFDDITFTSSEINYKDFFSILTYDYSGYYNSKYNGKNYVMPSSVNDSTLFVEAIYYPGSVVEATRRYKITFSVCVGDSYLNCKEVEKYDYQVNSSINRVYSIPLSNIVYNSENGTVNYDSFKLKGSYVCNNSIENNCDSRRSENNLTVIESEIYYLNLKNPTLNNELEGTSLSGCGNVNACFGINRVVTNTFEFVDDNNIVSVNYLISDTMISDSALIVDTFINGSEITLDKDDGLYYIYFKILDDSGSVSYRIYGYLLDFNAPELVKESYSDYNKDNDYNNIEVEISFSDSHFRNNYYTYYNISFYDELIAKEDVINENNLYTGKITLNDLVSDGSYKVCFVSKDPLDNYSNLFCSNKLNLDTTPLTKEEVSVNSDNVSYQKSLNINISINGLDDNASFKCGMFLDSIVVENQTELSSKCLNNSNNSLNVNGEDNYKLWIYASDKAGNYSLLKLDRVYYIDNLSPQVSYIIEGDNTKYSNDVRINVSVDDLNDIDNDSLSYMFYLNTYNEDDFINFNLDESISYPYDYYGTYKLAIKACDVINNCKINTYKDVFYIDTGEIKLELLGDDSVVVLRWGKYKDAGARASKGNLGKYRIDLDYKVEGSVDTNKVGVYYLTYSSGEGMNKVSVVREVIVKDSIPYIIAISSLVLVGEAIILLRLFIKKRKNDSI